MFAKLRDMSTETHWQSQWACSACDVTSQNPSQIQDINFDLRETFSWTTSVFWCLCTTKPVFGHCDAAVSFADNLALSRGLVLGRTQHHQSPAFRVSNPEKCNPMDQATYSYQTVLFRLQQKPRLSLNPRKMFGEPPTESDVAQGCVCVCVCVLHSVYQFVSKE